MDRRNQRGRWLAPCERLHTHTGTDRPDGRKGRVTDASLPTAMCRSNGDAATTDVTTNTRTLRSSTSSGEPPSAAPAILIGRARELDHLARGLVEVSDPVQQRIAGALALSQVALPRAVVLRLPFATPAALDE